MKDAAQASFSVFYRPVIPVATAVMAGIAWGVWLPGHVLPALAGVLLLAAWLLARVARQRTSSALALLFCALCGRSSRNHGWMER